MSDSAVQMNPAGRRRGIVALTLGIGLAARCVLLYLSPTYALPYDHHEYVRWSIKMAEDGLATIYDAPPRESLIQFSGDRRPVILHHQESYVCNYPPLAAVLFWLQGQALSLFDSRRVSNTLVARICFGALPILCDFVTAWGAWSLAQRLRAGPQALVALAAAILAPPLMIDSAFWGQTDSWLLAPAVWMLWAMTTRRWLAAGLLWGLTMSLKTQGVLLALVWLAAGAWSGPRKRTILGAAAGPLVLAVCSLPFTVHAGDAWLRAAFLENVATSYNQTTLKAFNIWYVDLLLCEDDDASIRLAGLPKDWWGKIILAAGLLAAAAGVHRRYRQVGRRLLVWTASYLLLAVMLPTRVHERYVVMCLPFLIAAAALRPRVWWGLAPLLVAAAFQVTVYQWVDTRLAAGWWPEARRQELAGYEEALAQGVRDLPARQEAEGLWWENYVRQRRPLVPYEWALTLLSLLSAAATLWCLFWRPPPAVAGPPQAVMSAGGGSTGGLTPSPPATR